MASLRRTLSPAIGQNGELFAGDNIPNHSHPSSAMTISGSVSFCSALPIITSENCTSLSNLSFLYRLSWRKLLMGSGSLERPKSKGNFSRRHLLHFLLCFTIGLALGFTPFSWSNSSSSSNLFRGGDARQEFALELNGFATNLQSEAGQTITRGEKIIERESLLSGELKLTEKAGSEMLDTLTSSGNLSSRSGLVELIPIQNLSSNPDRKLLIIVTPTYTRAFQAHYLTRLAHTLRLVPPPLLWLVVEMPGQTLETASMLRQTGIMYRHLVYKKNLTNLKDRGICQRNVALAHIEQHQLDGIVYFADDDNVYSLELFEQLRKIKRFGTWPVGMLALNKSKTILEGPVCDGEKVVGWHTNEKSKSLRRFHVDMSGFGFNSTILWNSERWHRPTQEPIRQLDSVREGFQETTFIEQLVEDESQMEGLPNGCSKIMVWHVHQEEPGLTYPSSWTLSKHLGQIVPLRTPL